MVFPPMLVLDMEEMEGVMAVFVETEDEGGNAKRRRLQVCMF